MSAKKVPRGGFDMKYRVEFSTKLKKVHQELATQYIYFCLPSIPESALMVEYFESRKGIGFTGPRLKKEFLCRNVLADGSEMYIGGPHPDTTKHVVFWNQQTKEPYEILIGSDARKWIQDYYTDNENRPIGGVIDR